MSWNLPWMKVVHNLSYMFLLGLDAFLSCNLCFGVCSHLHQAQLQRVQQTHHCSELSNTDHYQMSLFSVAPLSFPALLFFSSLQSSDLIGKPESRPDPCTPGSLDARTRARSRTSKHWSIRTSAPANTLSVSPEARPRPSPVHYYPAVTARWHCVPSVLAHIEVGAGSPQPLLTSCSPTEVIQM